MKHAIPITLTETDRASLQTFIPAGKANARTFTRARALLAGMQVLRERFATLEAERHAHHCPISWCFPSHDVRVKLHDLYPHIKNNLD